MRGCIVFNLADYISTSDAFSEWLEQDKTWLRLADRAHDGNLAGPIRKQARLHWRQREEGLIAKVIDTVKTKPQVLRIYLLPNIRLASIGAGRKSKEAVEYLISNPHNRSLTRLHTHK
jgi:hypothetical protein